MKKFLSFLFLFFLILQLISFPVYAQIQDSAFPKFRHDIQNKGNVESSYNGGLFNLSWKTLVNASGWSSPIISKDGTIYVAGNDAYLYAIYPNGSIKWKSLLNTYTTSPSSPLLDSEGNIYIIEENYRFFKYYSNGTQAWEQIIYNNGINTQPNIDSFGILYAQDLSNGNIYRFYSNGTELEIIGEGGLDSSTVAIDSSNVMYVVSSWGIRGYYPNITKKWENQESNNGHATAPIIDESNNRIYYGDDNPNLYALNLNNGTEIWTIRPSDANNGFWYSIPVIDNNGDLYVGSESTHFYGYFKNGTQKFDLNYNYIESSPTIYSNNYIVFTSSSDGKVTIISNNGNEMTNYTMNGVSSTSPAIANDGTIYTTSNDGYLYALNTNVTHPSLIFDPSGYVRDTNNAAISGATVILYNNTYSQSVQTDGTGHYSMTLPANGTYTYLAAKNGYINSTQTNQTFTNGGTNLTNITLSLSQIPFQKNPSIQFDKSTYTIGDTILITAYASKAGVIQILDSKGQTKLSVPVSAQTTSNQSYKILSNDSAGIWQAYLKDQPGSIVATTNARINIPTIIKPTPIPGLTSTPVISTCPSGVCSGVSWTIDDVFVWMRIYIPKLTELTLILYIIALFGSFKNMIPSQARPRQKTSWRR